MCPLVPGASWRSGENTPWGAARFRRGCPDRRSCDDCYFSVDAGCDDGPWTAVQRAAVLSF